MNEPALLDANLLVYAFYPKAPQYRAAHRVVTRAKDGHAGLCVSSQVLAEFYAVVTSPRRVNPSLKPQAVLQRIHEVRSLPGLTLLPLPVDVADRRVALIRRHPVLRRRIFDVHRVATMLADGVKRIYTFNVKDFEPFPEIEVIEPSRFQAAPCLAQKRHKQDWPKAPRIAGSRHPGATA